MPRIGMHSQHPHRHFCDLRHSAPSPLQPLKAASALRTTCPALRSDHHLDHRPILPAHHTAACTSAPAPEQATSPVRLDPAATSTVTPVRPDPAATIHDGALGCCSSGRCSRSLNHNGQAASALGASGRHAPASHRLLAGAAVAAALYDAAATASCAADSAAAAAAEAAAAATFAGLSTPDVSVAAAAAELAAAGVTSVVPAGYVPSPVEPGWEIWIGFIAGVVPFLIGSYEFGKRIIIQLRCEVCGGRGLVSSAGPGRYLRKCPNCGGFFPWISWKMFLSSTAAPGNGGPLQQPRNQKSVFYSVPAKPDLAKQAEALARSQDAIDALEARGTQRSSGTERASGASSAEAGGEGAGQEPQRPREDGNSSKGARQAVGSQIGSLGNDEGR